MEARMETGKARTTDVRSRGDLGEALWLAGRDVRAKWVSFPALAVLALVPGFYAILPYSAVFGGTMGRPGAFLLDLWFLLMVAVLNVNFFFNRDYYYRFREDNYTKHLSFLRTLPVSPRTIVAGRAMVMAVALACGTPSFFLAPYLAYARLRETIGPADYAWFVGIWLGYALFMMGFLSFMWNGLSWRSEKILLPLFPGLCAAVALAANLLFDGGLVMALIHAARAYGPLAAGASILLGFASLLVWIKAAEKGLVRRELG